MSVKIGTTFNAVYADGNCEWKVTKARGRGTWDCVISDDDEDWAGVRKVFGTEEIERSLAMNKLFKDLGNEHDKFYKSLKPGQIVHYDNGFGNYVRSQVVKKGKDNVLQPVALCGSWQSYDLPHHNRDGSVTLGYYPKMIFEKETFTPNVSCIWEGSASNRKKHPTDPSGLTSIKLDIPGMTPEAARQARIHKALQEVSRLAEDEDTLAIKRLYKLRDYIKEAISEEENTNGSDDL